MAPPMRLTIEALTDVGRAREHNEDSLLADPGNRFAIVADGMGGHNAGEVASALITYRVGAIMRCVLMPPEQPGGHAPPPPEGWLTYSIERANELVRSEAAKDKSREGMGST